ncbi:MAG: hypothetical protein FD155_959 [Bacteroidetes bacterium]|nr:MAG: hypothetical protein FD155_959 [Bacteroidota bacterium]
MKISGTKIFHFFTQNLEAWFWLTALVMLAFMNPASTQQTLCLWHYLGVDACPGCGLGHSISAAFHGRIGESFNFHPLGMIAIVVLCARIFTIFIQFKNFTELKTYQYDKNL